MLKTELITDKATLTKRREELKKKGYSECRLLHRTVPGIDFNGKEVVYKYQLTYYCGEITQEDLVSMGFRKAKKQNKAA